MSLQDALAPRINSKEDFQAYMDAVAQATEGYLSSLDEAALEQKVTVRPLGEMPGAERHRQHVPYTRIHPPGRDSAPARPAGAARHGRLGTEEEGKRGGGGGRDRASGKASTLVHLGVFGEASDLDRPTP